MSPIEGLRVRSLALVLATLLVACGSDDDSGDRAIEAAPIADEPGVGLTEPEGSDAGQTTTSGTGGEGTVTGGADAGGANGDGTGVGGTNGGQTDAGGTDAGGTGGEGTGTGGTDGSQTGASGTDAGGTPDDGTDAGDADGGQTDAGGTDAGGADTQEVAGGRPAVSIFPFDPAVDGVPVIDGAFDDVWQRATFADRSGESLLIDRLLIDRAAEAADGGVPYIWFAMHDFESLYLFVQFERTAPYTPFRDSERFFDDDALNLFFDGDSSRGERLEGTDGGDDRYIAIPLLAREGEERPEALAPLRGRAPEVPPSLEYGVCVCEGTVTGWELKIALSDLNIEVGRAFGFEVQIDQDLDGGARDARWGWSNPAPATGGTFVPESPALSGSVTLESERP